MNREERLLTAYLRGTPFQVVQTLFSFEGMVAVVEGAKIQKAGGDATIQCCQPEVK